MGSLGSKFPTDQRDLPIQLKIVSIGLVSVSNFGLGKRRMWSAWCESGHRRFARAARRCTVVATPIRPNRSITEYHADPADLSNSRPPPTSWNTHIGEILIRTPVGYMKPITQPNVWFAAVYSAIALQICRRDMFWLTFGDSSLW